MFRQMRNECAHVLGLCDAVPRLRLVFFRFWGRAVLMGEGSRLEAEIAAFGAFVRLGGDKASCREDPPDRRHRGALAMALPKVKCDRGRAGLMPIAFKFLT